MSDVVEVGVAYQAARAATAFINANKAAKKGELKKLLDFFRKYFNTQKLDDLINAIGNPNLKNFVVGLRTGDNFLIKQGEGAVNKLSIRTFHNNDFTELASIENNVLTIRKDGILDNGAEMATAQKLANDIEIRGANGENLSGKIEIATDDSGRGWFRVTKGSAIDASLERIRTSNPDMDIASFKADFGNDLDILTKFEKGELSVDSWKVLKEGNVDDVLRKNINVLEQLNLAHKGEFGTSISKTGNSISVRAANGDELIRLEGNQVKIGKHNISADPNNAVIKNVDEINNSYPSGWEAPYDKSMPPIEFKTSSNEQFVRVFTQDVNTPNGSWIMKKSDIDGLTPAQIKDKFAIPGNELPNRIVDVNIPSGTRLRTGKAASTSGGSGGGLQFEIPYPDSRPNTWFINERPL